MTMPLRSILKRQRNAEVILDEAIAVDPQNNRLLLTDGEVHFDTLILAAGARRHYFGNSQFERLAPGLKSIEDASDIRRRIMTAFETAGRHRDAHSIASCLTFVVVGEEDRRRSSWPERLRSSPNTHCVAINVVLKRVFPISF